MSIKDLFGKKSNKILTKQKLDQLTDEVESHDYIVSESISRNEFIPKIDFSDPANFVKYGTAELYYEDSIKSIYNTYPYDGSAAEKKKWRNQASYFDRYIFDNEHPRTTGYITLNSGAAVATTIADGGYNYDKISSPQYVTFFGGPNRDPSVTVGATKELSKQYPENGGNANIYDTTYNRESNLKLSGVTGNTVEFFCKVDNTDALTLNNRALCLFDAWNGNIIAAADYSRLVIEYDDTNKFLVTYRSAAGAGFEREPVVTSTSITTAWTHFAITLEDSGADCVIKAYADGELEKTVTVAGGALGDALQKELEGSIGSYMHGPTAALEAAGVTAEFGGYIGLHIDELRFWKAKRTSKDIGRHWFTQINGGVNTDVANTELGIYYKFNEGIFNTASIDSNDSNVLDYSGRLSNGTIQNYTITVRSNGSAIDEHTTTTHTNTEFRDPIIYAANPDVVSKVSELKLKGREYDYRNDNSFFKSMPAWIQEGDGETVGSPGNLNKLCQALGSYFDKLYMQIEVLPRIKDTSYSTLQEGNQPYSLAKDLLESAGFVAPELFLDASIVEELASRNEDEVFENRIHLVKNLIYQNIYNNIVYIYKSKGTEKAFRNLIRCFGVDEELIKLNLYADNTDYKIRDNVRHTSLKKKYANFNHDLRHEANVYQYQDPSDTTNTRSYILSHATDVDYIATTMEAEVIFPKDLQGDTPADVTRRTFTTSSLFGLHEADTGVAQDVLTFTGNDYGNFQVYAIREDEMSKNAKFQLVSTNGFPAAPITLTSDTFYDVYDGEKWNFAVRIKVSNKEMEITDRATGSTTGPTYVLEFYGVNASQNSVEDEFTVTQAITQADAQTALRAAKRVYCGAHRTNFTGSVLVKSDAKISSVRYWYDYLNDETIKYHAYDITNSGRLNPDSPTHFGATSLDPTDRIQVPEIETLALNWEFDNVTTTDGSGRFVTMDLSSGSLGEATVTQPYGWFSELVGYRHSGRGDFFPTSNADAVTTEYVSSAKQVPIENINSGDMINILSQDDETFTRESRPVKYFFAAEKSMYQAVSDEMLKVFSGIARFNDLIGDPANRYRMTYKNLEKLRQLFYERQITDVSSLEKYVDFYKWLDSSISAMMEKLFPASANFSPELRNVVESHVLERNKYWNKFPTLEMKASDPIAAAAGIEELLYDWDHGHAPVDPAAPEDETCLWHNERVERDDGRVTSGVAAVDADRESIRKAVVRDSYRVSRKLYDNASSTFYEGNTFALRSLKKPYRFGVEKHTEIRGGINYSDSKKDINNTVRSSTKITSAAQGIEIKGSLQNDPSCLDSFSALNPKVKNTNPASVTDATAGGYLNPVKGASLLPFDYHFSTPNATSAGAVPSSANRTNIHSDSYGELNEVPMQGPFTNQWVGGNQHRHVTLTTTQEDTARPELYVEVSDTLRHPHDVDTTNYAARYTRDGLAKRPLNVSNIKTVSGATEDSESNELPHGNYTHDYQVVQAHSRDSQNRWFVKNEGAKSFTSTADSSFITDTTNTGISFPLTDFELPDRNLNSAGTSFGTSDHVFVNRFSSPGSPAESSRGSLDAESEQYSPYSSVNYRNLSARQHLNDWHTYHTSQFGLRSTYMGAAPTITDVGAWHKNNRNPITRMRLINPSLPDSSHATKYGFEVCYDNFFVGHQLPRSDWQYSWIYAAAGDGTSTAPLSTVHDRRYGYTSSYANISVDAASSFAINGSITYADATTAEVPFVNLNEILIDPISLTKGLMGFDESGHTRTKQNYINKSEYLKKEGPDLNAILLSRNGPYGYPSWKQIRTGETKLVKAQRKNNIISSQDAPQTRLITSSAGAVSSYADNRADTFKNYSEPAAIWNSSIFTTFNTDESKGSIGVKHAYRNNLELFSNESLNDRLGLIEKDEEQVYDRLVRMYSSATPDVTFTSLLYKENIFPNHRYVATKYVRLRNKYTESSIKIKNNSSGYFGVGDPLRQHIRTFWKDTLDSRARDLYSYNALGYNYSPLFYDKHKQVDSVWALDDIREYTESTDTLSRHVLGDLAYMGDARYDEFISTFRPSAPSIKALTLVSTLTVSEIEDVTSPIDSSPSIMTRVVTASYGVITPESTLPASGGSPFSRGDITTLLSGKGSKGSAMPVPTPRPRIITTPRPITAPAEPSSGVFTGDSEFDMGPVDGPLGGIADATIPGSDAHPGFDLPFEPSSPTVLMPESEPPRPALQWIYNPYNADRSEKGWSWRAPDIRGKNPWYNSYDKYNLDIKHIGQNYGTISEFRISQHMKSYSEDSSGFNFRKENFNFLTLDGANHDFDTSANVTGSVETEYSRRGLGEFTGSQYPTITSDNQFDLIMNNSYIKNLYEGYKHKNQFYSAGTLTIDNSVKVPRLVDKVTQNRKNSYDLYNSIQTLAESNSWRQVRPYNGLRSAALEFNTTISSDDYIYSIVDKFESSTNGISFAQGATAADVDPFTLSFWVNPDANAYNNNDFMGSVCILNSTDRDNITGTVTDEMGIWLKCPSPTTGVQGGLTFYIKDAIGTSTTTTPISPASAVTADIMYHFMSYDSGTDTLTPVTLDTDKYNHIVLQFAPRRTGASHAKVMMWLNGERLYGIHPTLLGASPLTTKKAYTSVEIGADAAETAGTDITTQIEPGNVIIAGKNMVGTTREDKFVGRMNELSVFHGVLTKESIGKLYGKNTDGTGGGTPTNILEEFYNYELTNIYLDAAERNDHFGSTAPKTTSAALVQVNIATQATAELAIWWRMGIPSNNLITEETSSYSSEFFSRHVHSDPIKYIDNVVRDHSDNTDFTRKRITISADVVKKLIPYNGFYPSQRTVQLGNLFKEDYFDSIKKSIVNSDAMYDTQRLQSLLQCFMAPGILYNSLKSGIAVDWPAFTNDTGYEPVNYLAKYGTYTSAKLADITDNDDLYTAPAPNWYHARKNPYAAAVGSYETATANSDSFFEDQPKFASEKVAPEKAGFVILQEPNIRIPFEGLLSPESNLPKGNNLEISRFSNQKIFTSVLLDFDGFDCEGNDVSLVSMAEEDDGSLTEMAITIPIRRSADLIPGNTTTAVGEFEVTSTPEHVLSRQVAIDFAKRVNEEANKGNTGWVAFPVPSSDSLSLESDTSTLTADKDSGRFYPTSPTIASNMTWHFYQTLFGTGESPDNDRPEFSDVVGKLEEAGLASNGHYRVKMYYIGIPKNKEDYNIFDNLRSPNVDLLVGSSEAKIRITQYYAGKAGAASSEKFKVGGLLKLRSTLTTLGIKSVHSDGSVNSTMDMVSSIPSQTTLASGGVEVSSIFSAGRPNEVFFMAPEYYTGSINDITNTKRYPSFNVSKPSSSELYKRAMHNFLAEIPSFFLDGEKLTSFTSKPESEFKSMVAGEIYSMDVSCYNLGDLKTSLSAYSDTQGRYYGPSFKYKNADTYNSAAELIADPAQAPYTPPYFHGKSIARITFTPSESRKYSLDEILGGIEVQYFNEEARQKFNSIVRKQNNRDDDSEIRANLLLNESGCEESPAYKSMMNLDSSVALKNKVEIKSVEYDAVTSAPKSASDGAFAWNISTKFESPVFNFNNAENSSKLITIADDTRESDKEGIGMWSGYGALPKRDEGLFMKIEEAPGAGSLIDVCGFNNPGIELEKRIGKLASQKEISEAIVLVPFVDNAISGRTTKVENKNFFKIDTTILNKQKQNMKAGRPPVVSGDFGMSQDIEETSVSNMVKMMDKYYIPPQYNFEKYQDINPFVMYFIEFKHNLNQSDLSDIWQGVMPNISETAEKDSQSLSHDLTKVDLFGGKAPPNNVRWMIFRVKKKGKNNYSSLLKDDRFNFDFNVSEVDNYYSYNWPYDFFSLIELAKVDAGIEILSDESFDGTTTKFGELSEDKKEDILNNVSSFVVTEEE